MPPPALSQEKAGFPRLSRPEAGVPEHPSFGSIIDGALRTTAQGGSLRSGDEGEGTATAGTRRQNRSDSLFELTYLSQRCLAGMVVTYPVTSGPIGGQARLPNHAGLDE